MEIWKCVPLHINWSKPPNFQNHGLSPYLCRSGWKWRSGVTGWSPEVKWCHSPFFANKSWQDGDRDKQMVPNDLARRAASDDVHTDLLLGHDLTLTWPEVKLTFNIKKYMFRIGLTRRTRWCHFYFRISHIKKVINEKPYLSMKIIIFHLMTSGAKTIDLGQIWSKIVTGTEESSPMFFFEFFQAIIVLEITAIVCKKNRHFLEIWPLVTSTLTF